MKACLLCSLLVIGALGCAPRQAMTTWGYSHWYGGVSMEAFQQQQRRCLDQVGVAADPASVEPNSPQENDFLLCMNDAGWCTQQYACSKPGA